MKISFCTTCSNRLYQFEQTIDDTYNVIKNNLDTEWVIVNYGSKDNLHQFMMSRLPYMSNRVIYANEISGRPWHASCAKNASHVLASGNILFNLDCDNFVGTSLELIRKKFAEGVELLQMWTGVPKDGTYGRIAIKNELFKRLNGYDERLYAMSGQDSDLIRRGFAIKAKCEKYISPEFKAILNSKDESVKYIDTFGMTWDQLAAKNLIVTKFNIKNNILVANLPDGISQPKAEIYRGSILE
jgi:hypothetical protein